MNFRYMPMFFLLSAIGVMATIFDITIGDPNQETYLIVSTILFIGMFVLYEKYFPLHAEWNVSQDDVGGDIFSFVFIFGLIDGALKWLSPFVILAFLPDRVTGLQLSVWQQVIMATLVIEFGAWLSHWAHHKFQPLWALHAMHHSTERLYTLNNFRFHPLNHVLNYALAFLPLFIIGFSKEALLGYTALSLPILLMQHTNAKFEFGYLNYVFNTNTLHRWHHSTVMAEGNKNFGRALVIFDQIFGTYYYPSKTGEPKKIGLSEMNISYPPASNFLRQLAWPFSQNCCR